MDWIAYNARTQVFAKSLPMVYVRTLSKTLELVIGADANRARMWRISNMLKEGLRELGFYVGPGEGQICSVFIPIDTDTVDGVGMRTVGYVRDQGVFVTAIAYPVIPLGLLMFRMIPTAVHTEADVQRTLEVFGRMRDNLHLRLSVTAEEERKIRKVYGL